MDDKVKQLFNTLAVLLMEAADLKDGIISPADFREHVEIFKRSVDQA